jgi:hypothetical protein
MFLVCAPGSVAWKAGPGWRLSHGIMASWKQWHFSMITKEKTPIRAFLFRDHEIRESVSGR